MPVVKYATSIRCRNGHMNTFVHIDEWVPIDQESPWPDVSHCPKCGAVYPPDLGEAITFVQEVEQVDQPEVHPEERGKTIADLLEETDFESSGHETRKE